MNIRFVVKVWFVLKEKKIYMINVIVIVLIIYNWIVNVLIFKVVG